MKAGMDELRIIDDDVKEQMMSAFNGGLDANENQHKLAELNFEAWMRQLDAKVKSLNTMQLYTRSVSSVVHTA